MGEIVWAAGVNQSHSCPAVSQGAAPGKARGRSHAEDSGGEPGETSQAAAWKTVTGLRQKLQQKKYWEDPFLNC